MPSLSLATICGRAMQGLAALDIDWDEGPNAKVSTADIVRQMDIASQNSGVVVKKEGDVAQALTGAARKVEAVYQLPFLAHAAMEPMNCTVHVRGDGCDVWVGNQVVSRAQATAAQVTGLATREGPGAQSSYWRRLRPPAGR